MTTAAARPRFACDDHLGRLARWLLAAGFDTTWERRVADDVLLERCRVQDRVLLTRHRELARRAGEQGCHVASGDPMAQLDQVRRRFALDLLAHAFTRCLRCNRELEEAAPEDVEVPDAVREECDRFWRCPRCGRTYWLGGHVRRMRERFEALPELPRTTVGGT